MDVSRIARNDAPALQKASPMVWIPLEQRRTADQDQNKQIEDIDASETLRYLSSPPTNSRASPSSCV
jgi:hypothetical protein